MTTPAYWYRIEMMNGDETYCFFGSSPLSETEFVSRLSKNEYVLLENLIFFDEDQDAKSCRSYDLRL